MQKSQHEQRCRKRGIEISIKTRKKNKKKRQNDVIGVTAFNPPRRTSTIQTKQLSVSPNEALIFRTYTTQRKATQQTFGNSSNTVHSYVKNDQNRMSIEHLLDKKA